MCLERLWFFGYCLNKARRVFNATVERNMTYWLTMIAGYAKFVNMDVVMKLFDRSLVFMTIFVINLLLINKSCLAVVYFPLTKQIQQEYFPPQIAKRRI